MGDRYIKVIVRFDLVPLEFKQVVVNSELSLNRIFGRAEDSSWVLYAWLLGGSDFGVVNKSVVAMNKKAEQFLKSLDGELVWARKGVFNLKKKE